MAAPNKQPAGSRPAPGTAHEHGPHSSGKPSPADCCSHGMGQGIAPHGTPKPIGNGKANPLR